MCVSIILTVQFSSASEKFNTESLSSLKLKYGASQTCFCHVRSIAVVFQFQKYHCLSEYGEFYPFIVSVDYLQLDLSKMQNACPMANINIIKLKQHKHLIFNKPFYFFLFQHGNMFVVAHTTRGLIPLLPLYPCFNSEISCLTGKTTQWQQSLPS